MIELNLSYISKKLTEDVIQHAFRIKTNSEDSIKSIKVTRAAPAGEGLLASVYRIAVEGQFHKASFIVKALIHDQLLRKSIICSEDFFMRETFFYTKILPTLTAVQKSLGAKECLQNNIPVCYGSYIDGEDDYIILEDLAESGCKSLPNEPTKHDRDITLKALSHLHAVSMAMRETKPELFNEIAEKLSEPYYNRINQDWYAAYLKNAIDIDCNAIAELEDPKSSMYYKKFEKLVSDDVYEQLIDLTSNRDELAVFNHGDAWTPNFLCSEKATVAIDFQTVRCASVALDLSYFIVLCGNLVKTKEDFQQAVKIYYDFLTYYLRDMGFDENKVCSWRVLNEELKKYGKYGLLASVTSIPLIASERCDVLEKFEEKYAGWERIPLDVLWKLTPITSEKQKEWLRNIVKISADLGFI